MSPQIYNVNIKVEAKDNIYKEKLFWKASVRLIGTGKDTIKNQTLKVKFTKYLENMMWDRI